MFVCDSFDEEITFVLREQPTLECDNSSNRRKWVAFASIALVVFLLGGKCVCLVLFLIFDQFADAHSCAVPSTIFWTMYQHRSAIEKLGLDLQRHNSERGVSLNANQLARSKKARASFMALTVEIQWLLPKFEKFRTSEWFAGIYLLLLRLLQTTFMALVPSQLAQSAMMCCITMGAILLQSDRAPYRRASDNRIALLSQVLVSCWVFVLLLRINGMFVRQSPRMGVGILLCVITMALFVLAIVLANNDRLAEKRANRSSVNDNGVQSTEQSADGNDEKESDQPSAPQEHDFEDREAGSSATEGGNFEQSERNEESGQLKAEESASPSQSWHSFLSIGDTLCSAEDAEGDATQATTVRRSAVGV